MKIKSIVPNVPSFAFRIPGSGFRVQRFAFRVPGSAFRVQRCGFLFKMIYSVSKKV